MAALHCKSTALLRSKSLQGSQPNSVSRAAALPAPRGKQPLRSLSACALASPRPQRRRVRGGCPPPYRRPAATPPTAAADSSAVTQSGGEPSSPPGDGIPASFRALKAMATGCSVRDVAQVVSTPMVDVGADQVLIRVTHAGINGGCETFRARGEFWFERNKDTGPDGFALGAEGAGVIVAVGENVKHLAPGTACTFVGGAFAEYTLASAMMCYPVAEANAEVVALTISGVTACVGLEVTGAMQPSNTVLVTAAAGGTGHFAVQFAKKMGCHVVGTCGGAAKVAALEALGVDRVIDHTREDVGAVLQAEYPAGIDLIYEGVGGDMLETALANLAEEGTLLVVGYISEYPHESTDRPKGRRTMAEELFWSADTLKRDKQTIRGNVWPKDDRAAIVEKKRKVFEMYAAGELTVLVDERPFKGLDSIPDAVEHMLSGSTIGKVVVEI